MVSPWNSFDTASWQPSLDLLGAWRAERAGVAWKLSPEAAAEHGRRKLRVSQAFGQV